MAAKKSRKKPAKRRATTNTKGQAGRSQSPNKSEFIRSQPRTLSAKDVVAKATEAGITITERFVHTARSNAKRSPGGPRKPSTTSEETAFRGLVVAIGTRRATELVAEVEEKLAAVIAGG